MDSVEVASPADESPLADAPRDGAGIQGEAEGSNEEIGG